VDFKLSLQHPTPHPSTCINAYIHLCEEDDKFFDPFRIKIWFGQLVQNVDIFAEKFPTL
jgi:hypothetical protein